MKNIQPFSQPLVFSQSLARGAFIVALLFSGLFVIAADVSWTGAGGDNLWANALNWSAGAVPAAADTPVIGNNQDGTAAYVVVSATNLPSPTTWYQPMRLADNASDDSTLVIKDGGELRFATLAHIGHNGNATLIITNGTVRTNGSNQNNTIGNYANSIGYINILADGLFSAENASWIHIGNLGTGVVDVNGGRIYTTRGIHIGNSAGGIGTLNLNSGIVSVGRPLVVGNSGTGFLNVAPGTTLTMREFYIGENTSGNGIVEFGAGIATIGQHWSLKVGGAGSGVFHIQGGSFSGYGNEPLIVRASASGYGLLYGYGSLLSWNGLRNNGLVVADGEGVDRELRFSSNNASAFFDNTINNAPTGTNGWYAINKGKLTAAPSTSYTFGATVKTFNWGEAQGDEDIDLVNSFRISLTNAVENGNISASLLSPDRDDVAANSPLPTRGECVALWDVSFSKNFESVDFEARYDHAKVKGGRELAFSRWMPGEVPGEGKWERLHTHATGTEDAPYRVKTDGLLPQETGVTPGRIGLIGLFAYSYSLIIIK